VGRRLLGGPAVLTCAPLLAGDRETLLDHAARLGALRPDCVEWRADHYGALEPGDVPDLVAQIATRTGCPLLVTNRLPAEGGRAAQDEARRLAVLQRAAASGVPALVDVEMMSEARRADAVIRTAHRAGVAVVRSWHDFRGTPSRRMLLGTLRSMQDAGADVAKVAVTPAGPDDVLRLLDAGVEARRMFLDIPCVLMSMGPLGALSRFAGYFASDLTFAVGVEPSAPGQMDLELVRRVLAALGLRDVDDDRDRRRPQGDRDQ
jgi:3-dehydroquinate dehydratase-1